MSVRRLKYWIKGVADRKSKENKRPVKNSTSGYCIDIFDLQFLHFPLRKIQLTIGNKSKTLSLYPQLIHPDLPLTDLPVLYLKITTFRKLPTMVPSMKTKIRYIENIIGSFKNICA
jgi:hypothetical protein